MKIYYMHIQGVPKRSGPLNISENISFIEKCLRQKLQDLKRSITGLISLTFDGITKDQDHIDFFKWNSLFFIAYSYSLIHKLFKTLVKFIFIKYFLNY